MKKRQGQNFHFDFVQKVLREQGRIKGFVYTKYPCLTGFVPGKVSRRVGNRKVTMVTLLLFKRSILFVPYPLPRVSETPTSGNESRGTGLY